MHSIVITIQSTGTQLMTKHIKMAPYNPPYNNKVIRRLGRAKQLEQHKTKLRRKLNRAQKEATNPNPTRKVKLLEEEKLEKEVVYIRNVVCDVKNDVEDKTECYVYFDARYLDSNMHYDDKNDSWSYHPTPGLFRNATNVQFVDSINRQMPVPPHPDIIIL